MHSRRPVPDQRGTSTLEFVAVLPALLLIFLASVEVARAWLTAGVATSAVREGVRVAVVTPAVGGDPNNPVLDPGPAQARITEILAAAGLTAASISVTCTPSPSPPPGMSGCVPDSEVEASVTVNFETIVPLFLVMLGTADDPLVLHESATMRRE